MPLYWRGQFAPATDYDPGDVVRGLAIGWTETLFVCIQSCTADFSNNPGIGSQWEDYWEIDTFSGSSYAGQYAEVQTFDVGELWENEGALYQCKLAYYGASYPEYEPGVGASWGTAWEQVCLVEGQVYTEPYYGVSLAGSFQVAESVDHGVVGSFIVCEVSNMLVWRITAFNYQNDGYDPLADVLSSVGVEFS